MKAIIFSLITTFTFFVFSCTKDLKPEPIINDRTEFTKKELQLIDELVYLIPDSVKNGFDSLYLEWKKRGTLHSDWFAWTRAIGYPDLLSYSLPS